jgi:hypothetical protein
MARIEDPYHFLDLGFGYYMTSRFAAINQLNIAPNRYFRAVHRWQAVSAVMAAVLSAVTLNGIRPSDISPRLDR